MNDEIIEEWGTDTGISFVTSNEILRLQPNEIYDGNFNKQPERLNEITPQGDAIV